MKNLSTTKLISFKLAAIAISLFFLISCSDQKTELPAPNGFNIKNYVFKNQDPQSIAARNAIDKGAKQRNQRTVTVSGISGSANIAFNPYGYQYISGSSVYRPSAYIQNWFNQSIQVEIQSQAGYSSISSIWVSSGGSYSQINSTTYVITVPALTTVSTNFDLNLLGISTVETFANIYLVSPAYVAPDNSNDWVYPIK